MINIDKAEGYLAELRKNLGYELTGDLIEDLIAEVKRQAGLLREVDHVLEASKSLTRDDMTASDDYKTGAMDAHEYWQRRLAALNDESEAEK